MLNLNRKGYRELADLLSRARAALETPADLTPEDVDNLTLDLACAEDRLRPSDEGESE